MDMIYAPPSGAIEYPYSIWRLRKDNPNVMWGENPSSADLAPFHVYWVTPMPPPEVDMRTHRAEEARPDRRNNGRWVQAWTIRPATAGETAAYDLANAPQPDWMAFGIDLASHPGIAALWETLPGPVSGALPTALNEAGKGDPRLFTGLWQRITAAGAITPELLTAIADLATQHHLPAPFIAGLAPAEPERVRARDADGQFIADDPATPDVDEAWQ